MMVLQHDMNTNSFDLHFMTFFSRVFCSWQISLKAGRNVIIWQATAITYSDDSGTSNPVFIKDIEIQGRCRCCCGCSISDLQIGVRGRLSTSLLYWARALGLQAENFRFARAQNFRLVLVLVLQSEGRYCHWVGRGNHFIAMMLPSIRPGCSLLWLQKWWTK